MAIAVFGGKHLPVSIHHRKHERPSSRPSPMLVMYRLTDLRLAAGYASGAHTRAAPGGNRPRLSRAALDYLRLLKNPPVKIRFDIVEVLLRDGTVHELRHLPNTFAMERPYRYG